MTEGTVLVTGGAGFIGSNLADRLARSGRRVLVFDNFARAGAERNAAWLKEQHGGRVAILRADIRDRSAVEARRSSLRAKATCASSEILPPTASTPTAGAR